MHAMSSHSHNHNFLQCLCQVRATHQWLCSHLVICPSSSSVDIHRAPNAHVVMPNILAFNSHIGTAVVLINALTFVDTILWKKEVI